MRDWRCCRISNILIYLNSGSKEPFVLIAVAIGFWHNTPVHTLLSLQAEGRRLFLFWMHWRSDLYYTVIAGFSGHRDWQNLFSSILSWWGALHIAIAHTSVAAICHHYSQQPEKVITLPEPSFLMHLEHWSSELHMHLGLCWPWLQGQRLENQFSAQSIIKILCLYDLSNGAIAAMTGR